MYGNAGVLLEKLALDMVMDDCHRKVASLPDGAANPFDGSYLQLISEMGGRIPHCARLLAMGYIDQATTFAESHGGGTTSNLRWGRDDDEDDMHWLRRCLAQAHRMMAPVRRGRKR